MRRCLHSVLYVNGSHDEEGVWMTVQEQLESINMRFEELHREFSRFDDLKIKIDSEYDSKVEEVRRKYRKSADELEEKKELILKYYRIAKENSYKDLNIRSSTAKKPDIAKLNTMISKIEPSVRSDRIADQIIDLASSYLAYLEPETSALKRSESTEMAQLEKQKYDGYRNIKSQKENIIQKCEAYLKSDDILKMQKVFSDIENDYAVTPELLNNWNRADKPKKTMLAGFIKYRLDVPKRLSSILKTSFKECFDETSKNARCPVAFSMKKHRWILVEYNNLNEQAIKKGIQALILNCMRYYSKDQFKVSCFDHIHYNHVLLGDLAALVSDKNGYIEQLVSNSENGLTQSIVQLCARYQIIEQKLGTRTVYEHNSCSKEKFPLRLIIVNEDENNFSNFRKSLDYLLNNSEKFSFIVMYLTKSKDGGSKDTPKEKDFGVEKESFTIISRRDGALFMKNNVGWSEFSFPSVPDNIPQSFIERINKMTAPVIKGTKYFERYPISLPKKSVGRRKPLVLPFAVDDNDNAISCSFEDYNFAAYMMGAAGSGKSTLIHTLIVGILMNYHPDEVELWLLDFKMIEFKRYALNCPPHVKFVLLETSEDLVFDIIDRMTDILIKRKNYFARKGWLDIKDVPPETNIPKIFVIIDEFSQMSQIIKEAKDNGRDYSVKLENLLMLGRAFGFKFIFASQTYTTGVGGLSETARKQIQTRFALKNDPSEIKETLKVTANDTDPDITRFINALPAYETIFRSMDENKEFRLGKYHNMQASMAEMNRLIDKLNATFTAVERGNRTNDNTYIAKHPVCIDGNIPKTIASQKSAYKIFEANTAIDDNSVFIYPGVPCSFVCARPFILCDASAENILLVGRNTDANVNVFLSVINSYERCGGNVEIWIHPRTQIFKKYGSTVLKKYNLLTDIRSICGRIKDIGDYLKKGIAPPSLIVCIGYEMIADDLELSADDDDDNTYEDDEDDLSTITAKIKNATDDDEKRRIIEEFNAKRNVSQSPKAYDARNDLKKVLKKTSNAGVHFMFVFSRGLDFENSGFEPKLFRHKISFALSKDDCAYLSVPSSVSKLAEGVFMYTDGIENYSMRPHIYRNVTYGSWIVDKNGNIVMSSDIFY